MQSLVVYQLQKHLSHSAHSLCSGVREAAMVCIEELHQQLGSSVLDQLEALHAKPAQLKQLQERFSRLAANSKAVQDFPLFQAVTVETAARRPGSATSRSDCSSQVSMLRA